MCRGGALGPRGEGGGYIGDWTIWVCQSGMAMAMASLYGMLITNGVELIVSRQL